MQQSTVHGYEMHPQESSAWSAVTNLTGRRKTEQRYYAMLERPAMVA